MADSTSEWIDLERKVPDDVSLVRASAGRRAMSVVTGKGRKKKTVRMFVPRALFQREIKRWYNTALFDAANMDSPAGAPLKSNAFGAITQGGGAINRIGDAIFVHKVVYRYLIVPDPAVTWTIANLAWCLDTEPAVGISNWNVPFNTIGAASARTYAVAIPAYDTRARYKYLQRETIRCVWQAAEYNGAAVTAATAPVAGTVSFPIRRKVEYDATNNVYKGVELPFYGWSCAGTNMPQLNMSIEVFFEDA